MLLGVAPGIVPVTPTGQPGGIGLTMAEAPAAQLLVAGEFGGGGGGEEGVKQAVAPKRPADVWPEGQGVHAVAELDTFVYVLAEQFAQTPLEPRMDALPAMDPLTNWPAGHVGREASPVLVVELHVLLTYCELLGAEHAKQEARAAVLLAEVWYVPAGQAVHTPSLPKEVALPALYGELK
jgi:hypothetical protein